MTATMQLPVLADGGLSSYLTKIRAFPILSHDEEIKLANAWLEQQDIEAAQKLVTSHLRLVAKMAMNFRGYGLPVSDLISEGNIGLMQAVKRFDPDKGFRLSTYAMWWIRASINEYILRSWSMVKMGTSAAHKKLFFNLRKMKNRITQTDRSLSQGEISKIASDLNVPERDVMEMDERLYANDRSLNAPVFEGEGEQWIDYLEDGEDHEKSYADSEELQQQKSMLDYALSTLNEREQDIITKRQMSDPVITLDELSKIYNVSKERIRQIEARALEKMQQIVKETKSLPDFS